MADASTLQIGDVIASKYRVERVLGEGGMGQVLLAMHLDLHEHCAVKVLHRGALNHPDAYERFVREARVTRQLKSQHAVKVYDFGRLESGDPYIVMEFLEGVDFRTLLAQRGKLPVSEAVMYLSQACEAIGEAHAAGIVHRDLKPANLFLTQGVRGRPCVKVLDFGIAKMAAGAGRGPEREMTGNAMIGTLAYMSPEQMLSSRSVDHRADIWSLGVVLFRLLTNTFPFDDDGDGLAIVDRVINGTPKQLSAVDPSLPANLSAAVMCCLLKDREQRYQTAMDLADALSPFVVPEARPSSASSPRWEHTIEAPTQAMPARPSSATGPASPPLSPAAAPAQERTAFVEAAPIAPVVRPAADAQTGATWSKTGRRMPERQSRPWVVAAILVLSAAAAVLVWRLIRNPEAPRAATSAPTSPSVSAALTASAAPPVFAPGVPSSSASAAATAITALPLASTTEPGAGNKSSKVPADGAPPRATVDRPLLISTVNPFGEAPASPPKPLAQPAPSQTTSPKPTAPSKGDPFGDERK